MGGAGRTCLLDECEKRTSVSAVVFESYAKVKKMTLRQDVRLMIVHPNKQCTNLISVEYSLPSFIYIDVCDCAFRIINHLFCSVVDKSLFPQT